MNKTISQMIAEGQSNLDTYNAEVGAEALADETRFDEQEAEKLMEAIAPHIELIPDSLIHLAYKAQTNEVGTRIWFQSKSDKVGPFYADFVDGRIYEYGVAEAKVHAGTVKYDFRPEHQNNEPMQWEDAVFLAHQSFEQFERLTAKQRTKEAKKQARETAEKRIAEIASPEALVELYDAAGDAGDFSGQAFAMIAMILYKK